MVVRRFRRGDETGIRAVMDASFDVDRMPGSTHQEIEVAISRLPADPVGVGRRRRRRDHRRLLRTALRRPDGPPRAPASRPRPAPRRGGPHARRRARPRRADPLRAAAPPGLDRVRPLARPDLQLQPLALPAAGRAGRSPSRSCPTATSTHPWPSDIDVDAFVAFANAAWEGHPTPLHLTADLARLVADLPDFDPQGICIVARAEAPDAPVAFAKTELRPDDDGRPVGWIGQIGVLPADRGVGLGRWLLRWGVAYLRGRGAEAVELAVEAANDRALGLYLRNGFEPAVEWPHWVLPVDARISAPA